MRHQQNITTIQSIVGNTNKLRNKKKQDSVSWTERITKVVEIILLRDLRDSSRFVFI